MDGTAMQVEAKLGLREALDDFQRRFNSNSRAIKLATGWDRQLALEATDAPARYAMTIRNAQLERIFDGGPENPRDDRIVRLCASEQVLTAIFLGKYNPSTALLDGMLEVYSDARDKVRLEAMAMVIWGI
jgi:hypothetical protein